ncbi:Uncharacterised protein [uncultured archaeon]|nr:Uncharacterised protein [uncultured archaeon]
MLAEPSGFITREKSLETLLEVDGMALIVVMPSFACVLSATSTLVDGVVVCLHSVMA